MAAIYAGTSSRCREHPQRDGTRRCDRCRQPFCDDCLSATERAADGTRAWYCRPCAAALAEATALGASPGARQRARAAARRAAVLGGGLLGVAAVLAAGTALTMAVAPRFARGRAAPEAYEARCGELSRIRSVSAIGTQSPDDAVNVFAYPQRATVRLAGAPAGIANTTEVAALVDECDTGWRLPAAATGTFPLPVTLELETSHVGSYVQRIALWQDPSAPRAAWVKDFEVLVSEQAAGEDFRPVQLDRPAVLRDSREAQWFQLVQSAGGGQGPVFTESTLVRRIRLRLKSTYGGGVEQGIALGEVAAYGSDREIVVFDLEATTRPLGPQKVYGVTPPVINALRNTETFVRFTNNSRVDHHIVTGGGTAGLDLPLPAGQTRTGSFSIVRGAELEFYCKLNTHALDGLIGVIRVK